MAPGLPSPKKNNVFLVVSQEKTTISQIRYSWNCHWSSLGLLDGSVVKKLPVNAGDIGDMGSIPGSGRSPGGGNGNPFQYSSLENSMGRGAWRATIHGVTKSQIGLSDWAGMLLKASLVSSVAKSCPTLWNPRDYSMPSIPVHHQLPELAQTHVHRVGDAIQPSHPLSFPSPPAFNLSQPSGSFPVSQFFISGGQRIGVSASASVLLMNIQDWFPLGLTGSPCSPRESQESSSTPQFKSINSSVLSFFLQSNSHPYMTTGKIIALTRQSFLGKVVSLLFSMLSIYLPWSDGTGCYDLNFLNVEL